MKYSIRGKLHIDDGSDIVELLNDYRLWRLITNEHINRETKELTFGFEAWVNTIEEKDLLFNALKPFVDSNGESIDWHLCSHDEEVSQPCVIVESYIGGE